MGIFLPVSDGNQHRRATIRRSRSGSQVVHAHRWWSSVASGAWTFANGSKRAIKKPETYEKGDRSEPGSVGANEKARRGDKQRSRHGATVLHAWRPPRDVRMSRVLSIPEAHIKSSKPFVLEPYRMWNKRDVRAFKMHFHFRILHTNICTNTSCLWTIFWLTRTCSRVNFHIGGRVCMQLVT